MAVVLYINANSGSVASELYIIVTKSLLIMASACKLLKNVKELDSEAHCGCGWLVAAPRPLV